MAPLEQGIAKQAALCGLPLPDRIKDAPELRKGLEIYLEAFFELSPDRSVSFGTGPIPWSSIAKYAEFYKFEQEQAEDLVYFVRQMDSVYIKYCEKKNKTPANGKKPKR